MDLDGAVYVHDGVMLHPLALFGLPEQHPRSPWLTLCYSHLTAPQIPVVGGPVAVAVSTGRTTPVPSGSSVDRPPNDPAPAAPYPQLRRPA